MNKLPFGIIPWLNHEEEAIPLKGGKAEHRDEIARLTEEYLARGGEIKRIRAGEDDKEALVSLHSIMSLYRVRRPLIQTWIRKGEFPPPIQFSVAEKSGMAHIGEIDWEKPVYFRRVPAIAAIDKITNNRDERKKRKRKTKEE
jgi:hypothetical protein